MGLRAMVCNDVEAHALSQDGSGMGHVGGPKEERQREGGFERMDRPVRGNNSTALGVVVK